MAKQIIVNVVFLADGSVDQAATDKQYFELRDKLKASITEDFDSVAVDITTFLLQSPGLKTIPTSSLVRNLWEQRILSGATAGKTHDEKQAMFTRLEELVPEYVKATPQLFHMGRKTGIAVFYVPGENQKDSEGNDVYDSEGNPVQAYRHTPEEWAKLTAAKPKPERANGTTATAASSTAS